jgi:hypothetical protein
MDVKPCTMGEYLRGMKVVLFRQDLSDDLQGFVFCGIQLSDEHTPTFPFFTSMEGIAAMGCDRI